MYFSRSLNLKNSKNISTLRKFRSFFWLLDINFFCLTSNRAFWVINNKEEVTWPALIRCRQIAALLNWSNSIQVYLAYSMVYDEWITYFIYPRLYNFVIYNFVFCIYNFVLYIVLPYYVLIYIIIYLIIYYYKMN